MRTYTSEAIANFLIDRMLKKERIDLNTRAMERYFGRLLDSYQKSNRMTLDTASQTWAIISEILPRIESSGVALARIRAEEDAEYVRSGRKRNVELDLPLSWYIRTAMARVADSRLRAKRSEQESAEDTSGLGGRIGEVILNAASRGETRCGESERKGESQQERRFPRTM